ncbi:unnamed protein product [Rotaria socialis]|uniref:Uncharacterized protein n=1 Tax=Rotaria socialis TaxID=392032 RepID=A0A818GWA3_9BILA|nr:unnamed protein product [Rotaria socialis]CAF3719571.1 unnamed protein product [Rotaria socialis]
MNVLRFSIQLRTQFMREECLKEQEENESILDENINSIENETTIAQQTPFFNKHVFMEDQQGNEFEMIIKGKLWKGEQTKHRRRAKRT